MNQEKSFMNLARVMRKTLFHRLLSLLLMFTVTGISPGIFDAMTARPVYAAPFTENSIEIDKNSPMAVSTPSDSAVKEFVADKADDKINDEIVKREMSKAEEIAWSIGKALLPTLAVMAFSAAVVCPLSWVVIGAVLVGATAAGAMTLGYELRKNSFRSEGEKKTMDKILREVSIQAAISGAMAPFNMLTAGMVQAVGPLTAKTIIQTAAKAGAVSYLGSTVSNVTKGAVTNLWYDHYYNYDEREKLLKTRISALEGLKERTEEQEKDLVAAIKELDTISKEKYTWDNFRQDERKALVSAGISGVLGGAASRWAGNSDWAKIVSSKLFGSTGKANLVANAVVSNPFAFATGAASAAVDKKEILNQIEYNRMLQVKYEKDSAAWNYYQEKIADLETAYKNIDLSEAGKQSMLSNAANQAAVVGVSLAKTRLWDLPSEKRQKIQQAYEEQDPKWQKANEIRQQLEVMKAQRPVAADYATRAEFTRALRDYVAAQNELRNEYQRAKIDASNSQGSVENKQRLNEISSKVSADIELNRQAELARALGREAYVDFKMKELGRDPENASLNNEELRQKAEKAVAEGYETTAKNSAVKLAKMEEKLERQNMNLSGKVEKGADGKHYVIVTDDNGQEVMRKEYKSGDGAFWLDKVKGGSVNDMRDAEIKRVVREAYDSAAMVKPSTFRNEFVNMRVNQLLSEGYTDQQIDSKLGSILDEANGKMYQTFGGNWQTVAKAEILASGLEKARYDDGAAPNMGKILEFLKKELSNRTISTVQSELKSGITTVVPKSVMKIDPLAPVFKTEQRDEETLQRLTDKAMREYYDRYNQNYHR
jgi:hypothetical protein